MFGSSTYPTYKNNGYKFLKISNSDNSAPTLVLLHGMFGGLSNFDPLISRLEGYSIYVPFIPLYSFDRDLLTIPQLAKWLHKFCTSAGIESPVLLGNSMGGHIALEYARTFPSNISGLVLAGSSGLFENDFGSTCPKRNDREYIRKQAARTFYEDIVTDELVDEIMEVTQSPQKLPKLLKIARATHSHNMESELGEITIPTLLVWGRDDVVTPPEVATIFNDKLPNASLKWIDRCGHAPMMECPDEFATHLKTFLQQIQDIILNQNGSNSYERNYSHE